MMKTYSHLNFLKRIPTDYEIAATSLDYYQQRNLEVEVPFQKWRDQYQCHLSCKDWNGFYDPRETTFALYTHLQSKKEIFVEGIFESIEEKNSDQEIRPEWRELLENVVVPMRFVCHGLQMISAYLGHLSPNSRVTLPCLFQAADEMRAIQRIAYRAALLRKVFPEFAGKSREKWMSDEFWQPFRQLIEQLLVTYDWTEAFVAANLTFKPFFDRLFFSSFQKVCLAHGDYFLAEILRSLDEDRRWHRSWAQALVRFLGRENSENRKVIFQTYALWNQRLVEAFREVSQTGLMKSYFDTAMTETKRELETDLRLMELV